MSYQLELQPGQLTLAQMRHISRSPVQLTLTESAWPDIERAAKTVADVLAEGRVVYGINTGFGLLASTRIAADQLSDLQRRIVLSHAAGVGELMADSVVRLMLVLKINSLARGYSGIRPEVMRFLLELLNNEAYPCVPSKGSVGACGDLAPLAHLVLPLLGEGEIRYQGQVLPSADVLKTLGMAPMTLAPKEGLALLNGTQASTALALHGLFAIEDVFRSALLAGGMAVEAALGSRTPFDARIHEVRGQLGQIDVAAELRTILGASSEIGSSHLDCEKVQDPYSLRCQPQVMGAIWDQIRNGAIILEREGNGVTDNPLVFSDDNDILSGGNFHAEPVALVADSLAVACSEIGSLSERRIALLVDRTLSNLPAFLVENGGVNSGFMLAQVTAAALASENKTLSHPASVDSIPTSANQEDHVSMATFAARRLEDIAENTASIVAIELLATAQGIDFRRPLKSSPVVEATYTKVREKVSYYAEDRYFSPDIIAITKLIRSGELSQLTAIKMARG
ncbi:histidine ammonia-lyase [Aliidiomarina quisquiliarum]|uniref:histidine ammonia-lyase n=1 Tax=Aliidiomarina quisquiliarum TaxID=2938947 RepID=UPI00208E568C|nr:histidine ammonia-lyase [Aliidiomarina quisquiliarum]MCO4322559.1 histidine ammonia-lyase [Aliidiomarina quisquiliarum]